MNKFLISFFLMNLWSYSFACSYPLPTIIPPTTPYGEFQYVYPELGPNYEEISNSKDLAIVKLYKTAGEKNYPEVVIVELLHGWGYRKSRYMKFLNPKTSCGSSKISGIGWYAAVIKNKKIETLIPYEKVKIYLKKREKPHYVYLGRGFMGSVTKN